MKKSTRRATVTAWGLAALGALCAIACGSGPNWQNQYTEEPAYSGPGASDTPDDGGGGGDAGAPSCPAAAATCKTILSGSPASSSAVPTDPQGNPDPVPWAIHPVIVPRKTE